MELFGECMCTMPYTGNLFWGRGKMWEFHLENFHGLLAIIIDGGAAPSSNFIDIAFMYGFQASKICESLSSLFPAIQLVYRSLPALHAWDEEIPTSLPPPGLFERYTYLLFLRKFSRDNYIYEVGVAVIYYGMEFPVIFAGDYRKKENVS